MIHMDPMLLTILMLASFTALVIVGYPVALSIGSVGLIASFFVWPPDVAIFMYFTRVWAQANNYTLLAVPLFIFMGYLMEYSGMTEKLYEALYVWMGGVKGGLALVTMTIGIVIGGPVGVVSAAVSMLAVVGMPAMVKKGYDKAFAAGVVAAGGTLGILIPPSVMFVVYGPMANISVGKLFFASVGPGFLLSFIYLAYILIKCWLEPHIGPPIPKDERISMPLAKKTWMLVSSLVAPTILTVAVLGVIFFGIAAPTEVAALGATATALICIANRRFTFAMVKYCTIETFKTSGFIFLLATMGFAFAGVFVAAGGTDVIAKAFTLVPGGRWGAFVAVMSVFFLLGFALDWLAMVYIMVPTVTVLADILGFDPLWFAMMICINFQMEFITPPFAMAIFVVKGSTPKELDVTMSDCIRGIWPYCFLVMVGLALCVAFPEIILWLPNHMITIK